MKLHPNDVGKQFKLLTGEIVLITGFSPIWEKEPYDGYAFLAEIPHLKMVTAFNRDGVCRYKQLKIHFET